MSSLKLACNESGCKNGGDFVCKTCIEVKIYCGTHGIADSKGLSHELEPVDEEMLSNLTCKQIYKNDDSFLGQCTICNSLCQQCNTIYIKNESFEGGCPHCYRKCLTCKVNYTLVGNNYRNQEKYNQRLCTDCQGLKVCSSCHFLFKPHRTSKNNICENCSFANCFVCNQTFSTIKLKNKVCEQCSVMVECSACANPRRAVFCTNIRSEHIYCKKCATILAKCKNCKRVDFKKNFIRENMCEECSLPKFWYFCSTYRTNIKKNVNAIFTCERCYTNGYEYDFSSQNICKSCNMKDLNEAKSRCNECFKNYPGSTNDSDEICQCEHLCNNCNELIDGEFAVFDCRHKSCKNCQKIQLETKCPCCFDVYKCPLHTTVCMIFLKSDFIFYSRCCEIYICSICKKNYRYDHICL